MTSSTEPAPAPEPGLRDALARVRVVLVRPRYGGNIGATCRAMANMGIHELVLADLAHLKWLRQNKWPAGPATFSKLAAKHPPLQRLLRIAAAFGARPPGRPVPQPCTLSRDWAPEILQVAGQPRGAGICPEDDG